MADVPDDLRYTKDHEWAKVEGKKIRVGITAFAVEQLGDITLVELPKVGTKVEEGKAFGTVESVKTLSDLFAPIAGTIVEVNEKLASNPELVNEAAYEKGWMVVIEVNDEAKIASLMDAATYRKHLEAGH
jgi:glycine cleavage system H protein